MTGVHISAPSLYIQTDRAYSARVKMRNASNKMNLLVRTYTTVGLLPLLHIFQTWERRFSFTICLLIHCSERIEGNDSYQWTIKNELQMKTKKKDIGKCQSITFAWQPVFVVSFDLPLTVSLRSKTWKIIIRQIPKIFHFHVCILYTIRSYPHITHNFIFLRWL